MFAIHHGIYGSPQITADLREEGWRVSEKGLGEHHNAELVYPALVTAVAIRGGKNAIAGVIMHADHGREYTAGTVRAACTRLGTTQSMGRRGSALDSAVIESWHSTLEFELRSLGHFTTRTAGPARVAALIEDYNHERRHSALGMHFPVDYELTHHDHEPEHTA